MRTIAILILVALFLTPACADELPKKDAEALEKLRKGLDGTPGRFDPLVEPALVPATSESVEAVAAVASLIDTAHVDLRARFVLALPTSNERLRAQVEKLLVARLDDTDAMGPIAGVVHGDSEFLGPNMDLDPRVCDLAGHMLAALAPDRYTFHYLGSFATRERERIEVANVYRAAHGMAPRLVPVRRKVDPLAPERAAELEKEWRSGGESRRKAEEAIASSGLSALAAVRSWLKETTEPEPRRALTSLAHDVANVTQTAAVSSRSVPLSSALQKRLGSLEGKPLTARAFMEVLLEAWKARPDSVTRARLEAHRNSDQAGFEVRFEQLPERRLRDDTYGVSISAEVWCGKTRLVVSPGGMSCYGGHEETWQAHADLVRSIDRALAEAELDDPIVIRVAFVRP